MAAPQEILLPDLAAMEALGSRIANLLGPGDVVALAGDLGTGKTTLARSIIKSLGHEGEVPSPSFTIIETYQDLDLPLIHADFYRLDDPDEVQELGLDDYREGAAMLAEWPENAGGFAHEPQCLSVTFEFLGENGADGRKAIVQPGSAWLGRWT